MRRSAIGAGLLVVGLALVAAGVWGLTISGGDAGDEVAAAGTTTTTVVPPSTTATTTSTTTSGSTSTTRPPTTTTAPATTTTTIDPATRVEAFVVEFASAIEAGDVDFLYDTLSPDVVELFGSDLCRGFIEDEILLLEDYRVSGEVTPITDTGPVDQFEVPVTFTFRGSEFESNAMFAIDDGVRWFGECR